MHVASGSTARLREPSLGRVLASMYRLRACAFGSWEFLTRRHRMWKSWMSIAGLTTLQQNDWQIDYADYRRREGRMASPGG